MSQKLAFEPSNGILILFKVPLLCSLFIMEHNTLVLELGYEIPDGLLNLVHGRLQALLFNFLLGFFFREELLFPGVDRRHTAFGAARDGLQSLAHIIDYIKACLFLVGILGVRLDAFSDFHHHIINVHARVLTLLHALHNVHAIITPLPLMHDRHSQAHWLIINRLKLGRTPLRRLLLQKPRRPNIITVLNLR